MRHVEASRVKRVIINLSAASLMAVSLTGCLRGKTHNEWVNQANTRWHEARGQLMLPMAQQAFDTGDLDRAERTVVEALTLDESNPHFYLLAGRIQLERGKLERAFYLFRQAVQLQEKFADAHYYMGIVYQRWSKFTDAEECYRKAYELEPDQPHFLLSQCEAMVATGRRGEALSLLEDRLTYFDQNAGVRVAAAHLHMMDGNSSRAIELFREASLLDPDDPKIQEELATTLFSAGFHREAAEAIALLLRDAQYADRNDLRRMRASAIAATGDVGRARQAYLELTRIEPEHAGNWVRLGELAWQQNDDAATITAANRAISLAPHLHEGYLLAGMAWQKRGRTDDAVRNFDRAAELAPDQALPLIMRGLALQQAGKPSAAAAAYRAALQREPEDQRAQRLLRTAEVQTQP